MMGEGVTPGVSTMLVSGGALVWLVVANSTHTPHTPRQK